MKMEELRFVELLKKMIVAMKYCVVIQSTQIREVNDQENLHRVKFKPKNIRPEISKRN